MHEYVTPVSCSSRDRHRNRPFGIGIFDSDADIDSDREVSRFLPLFSEQPLMRLWRTHAHEEKTKAATDFTNFTNFCFSGMESSIKSV